MGIPQRVIYILYALRPRLHVLPLITLTASRVVLQVVVELSLSREIDKSYNDDETDFNDQIMTHSLTDESINGGVLWMERAQLQRSKVNE